jgi:hypothetical protein
MITPNFRIAMMNQLRLAPYYDPLAVSSPTPEWLIVERMGSTLTISDTQRATDGSDTEAPVALTANNTLVGVLIETSDEIDTFLFMRHLPPPLQTAGGFFPADGYARLSRVREDRLALSAHGRHALLPETRNGQSVLVDMGLPSPSAPEARTWHFDAVELPWAVA